MDSHRQTLTASQRAMLAAQLTGRRIVEACGCNRVPGAIGHVHGFPIVLPEVRWEAAMRFPDEGATDQMIAVSIDPSRNGDSYFIVQGWTPAERLFTKRELSADGVATVLGLWSVDPARSWSSFAAGERPMVYRTVKPRKRTGCGVYFVQAVNGGPVKIGFSSRPIPERIANLQTSHPYRLDVLLTIDGPASLEREMHQRFASARLRGEWFEPTHELLRFIAREKETNQ